MNKHVEYVKAKLTERELLEQAAEECFELGKAFLKKIRAKGLSGNVTPMKADEADQNVDEEINDLISVLYVLGHKTEQLGFIDGYWKWERWATRLGYVEEPKKKPGRPKKAVPELTIEELIAQHEAIKADYKAGKIKSKEAVQLLKLNAEAQVKAKRREK